jgi:hypothetical protein
MIQSGRKVLQAGLHFIFNAAVILLLNRLMTEKDCSEGDAIHGSLITSLPVDGPYASSVEFAIRIFEEEARTGTNYPRDCSKVLQDLKTLTDRYLATTDQDKLHQRNFNHYIDNAHLANVEGDVTTDLQPPLVHFSQSDVVLYGEIMTWMQVDGLQLHNSSFI